MVLILPICAQKGNHDYTQYLRSQPTDADDFSCSCLLEFSLKATVSNPLRILTGTQLIGATSTFENSGAATTPDVSRPYDQR